MKIAVIGSRNLTVENLEEYLPPDVTEIVSGGAKGIDACARLYATEKGIPYTEFVPDYARYGRWAAPIKRNETIVDYADGVVALWDGTSRGTAYVIDYCRRLEKPLWVYELQSRPPAKPGVCENSKRLLLEEKLSSASETDEV